MKIYYNHEYDILCIVEGKKIYKYIGDFCPKADADFLSWLTGCPVGNWYESENHPNNTLGIWEVIC